MIKALSPEEFTPQLIAPIFREVDEAVPVSAARDRMDLGAICRDWTSLMRNGFAKTWAAVEGENVVGLLGGLFVTEFFTGKPMAMEQFWFVSKSRRKTKVGISLLREFERESIRRGVKTIWAGSNRFNDPQMMAEMYPRLGYDWWGSTFRKQVEEYV